MEILFKILFSVFFIFLIIVIVGMRKFEIYNKKGVKYKSINITFDVMYRRILFVIDNEFPFISITIID